MSNKEATSPAEEVTGQSALPLSRVKKIIQLDKDIAQCSHNATFLIATATEMFIEYLVEQGHNVMKSERKPRKTLQYKDLATAVSRIDNLEFLADVIPKTTTYRQFKEKRAKEAARDAVMEKGQRKLNESRVSENGTYRSSGSYPIFQTRSDRGSGQPYGAQLTMTSYASTSHSKMIVDRTIDNSAGRNGRPPNEDVEMTG